MRGRLNTFQRAMLQWDGMHPYNAVHVLRIRCAFDEPRLRTCIKTTLEERGLRRLTLDHKRGRFEYGTAPADCELQVVQAVEASPTPLMAEVERQLNLPFACVDEFNPFRFLAASTGGSFLLGLSYFHPVSDAESVAVLLRDIVRKYRAGDAPTRLHSLQLYPDHAAWLLPRHPWAVGRRLLGLPAMVLNFRRSHRPKYRDANDMKNGFVCFPIASEALRSVLGAAKAWQVTVNDLFLALLLKALSPLASGRMKSRKRRRISVGCIVNLRKDLGVDSGKTFGLFLGSFTVSHEVPNGISLRVLAGDIGRQTSVIKRHKGYLGTPVELNFARFVLRLFSPRRQKAFYAKNYPLWGGITNVNLNSLWEPDGADGPLDYFRGVSTGPVTPLALSVTTAGDRANVGVSYRTTVFTPADIESLRRHFAEHIEETRKGA